MNKNIAMVKTILVAVLINIFTDTNTASAYVPFRPYVSRSLKVVNRNCSGRHWTYLLGSRNENHSDNKNKHSDLEEKMVNIDPDSSPSSLSSPASTHLKPLGRRHALAMTITTLTLGIPSGAANAFDKTFPEELSGMDRPNVVVIGQGSQRSTSQQRATAAAAIAEQRKQHSIHFNIQQDLFPSIVWGGALWLLSGSRSNPLATPLANVLYNEKDETWLQDRNAGLFAALPAEFLVILGLLFVLLGTVTQLVVLQLAEGDTGLCLQLAGVALIGGGWLELGRIASGEKQATREESDRAQQLEMEFKEFASKRLLPGGNCHRSDVVSAFRRYYGKYRRADSEEYPLTDLEIEKLLRAWNKYNNQGRAEMTSGGFYYGIQINKEADVFV